MLCLEQTVLLIWEDTIKINYNVLLVMRRDLYLAVKEKYLGKRLEILSLKNDGRKYLVAHLKN